ncbi:fibronectin type III domain-containing protein [Actinoplanes sp. NPDC051494]|uniref:fibronectin type III domain-containing protein n=1 Tax=Actinoplanes sp. NPDC051494 TaxID=3363907 RepID=UPI0037BD5B4B
MSTPARRIALAAATALTMGVALLSAPSPASAAPDPLIVKLVAGTSVGTSGAVQAGPALTSPLNGPTDLAFDERGSMYISDSGNCQVQKVSVDGVLSTVAGTGCGSGVSAPTTGPAVSKELGEVTGVAYDSGNLYVSDSTFGVIYKIDATGTLTLFAGTGTPTGLPLTGGPADQQALGTPGMLSVLGGFLYFPDPGNYQFAKIALATGALTVIAGDGTNDPPTAGIQAVDSAFLEPAGIAVAPNGDIYLSDFADTNGYRVGPDGVLVRSHPGLPATALGFTPAGLLYTVNQYGYIDQVNTSGSDWTYSGGNSFNPVAPVVEGPALSSPLSDPRGLDFDKAGAFYAALKGSNQIIRLSAATRPQTVAAPTAVAGSGKATVTWNPPTYNGGWPVYRYMIAAYKNGTWEKSQPCPATPLSCEITGLTNGASYRFTVAANTNYDSAFDSNQSTPVVPIGAPAKPAAPTVAVAPTTATVTWVAPADNGSAILGYSVQAYQGGSPVGTPCSPPDPVTLHCTVTGLTNGVAYTFTVTATNGNGAGPESNASLAATPADKPAAPTVTDAIAGPGAVTVKWTAPADNGATITGYSVQAYDGVTPVGSPCVPPNASTLQCVVTGLTNGTEYKFKVTATNTAGTSDAPAQPANPATPQDKPGMPTVVSAVPHPTSVTVTWNEPSSDGGSEITAYEVKAYTGGTPLPAKVCAPDDLDVLLACTVTGLTNGTSYTFKVTATNDQGSTDSVASVVAIPVDVPSKPTVTHLDPGPETVTVSWDEPEDDGGSPITGYSVQAYLGVDPAGTVCTQPDPDVLECEVTDLQNGVAYRFKVTALNGVAAGTTSDASGPATPVDVPDVPAPPTAVPGPGKATVTWTAPAFNGGTPIIGYLVKAKLDGEDAGSCTPAPLTDMFCVIDGLENGFEYTFTVSAINDVDPSDESNPSDPVIPVDAPGIPADVEATAGKGEVTVTWTVPEDNGLEIDSYTVLVLRGGDPYDEVRCEVGATTAGGVPGTDPVECVVDGLDNGTPYTFRVTAHNSKGDSDPSDESDEVTPLDAPTAPIVTDLVPGSGEVKVTWDEPEDDNGSPILSYSVQAYEGDQEAEGSDCLVTVTNDAESPFTCTIDGLTNGTAYTFRVVARNEIGLSEESRSGPATPFEKPGAPTGLIVSAGDSRATVSWSAPTYDGGSAITSYRLRAYLDEQLIGTVTCGTGTLSCAVTGLTNGTSYVLRVAATNAAGTGPESVSSGPVTPVSAVPPAPASPGAPTAVAGVSSITASWPAATGNVTGYTAYASPGSATCSTSSASDRTCVLGGTAGTSYTVTVVARGPGGNSAASPASNAVTPTAPVEPPVVPADVPVTLTTDKGQLSIAVPAQTITVIGTGFAPFSTAKVTIYSDPIVLGTVTTDAAGSFSVPVTIPAGLESGKHTFVAQGVDPQGVARQMALPVTVAPSSSDSSGSGDESQNTTLPVPTNGAITLLDAGGNPVGTVTIAGQGTYALDATTGIISFVPVTGFKGKATPVTYRITDSIGTMITGTYTAVVTEFAAPNPGPGTSTGSVKVIVPKQVVTRGVPRRATMTATATFTSSIKGRSTVRLWSTVSGKRVVLGNGTILTTKAGRRVAVPVTLNPLGRALTARAGGYPVSVAITTVPSAGRTLRGSAATHIVLSSFTVPRSVYFATAKSTISKAQQKYLLALRAKLGGARSVTCTGHTDDRGNKAASLELGRKRARAVCATLVGKRNIRIVIVTKGDANPTGSNKTPAGMARNRRADITLFY